MKLESYLKSIIVKHQLEAHAEINALAEAHGHRTGYLWQIAYKDPTSRPEIALDLLKHLNGIKRKHRTLAEAEIKILADEVDSTPGYLWQIAYGQSTPSPKLAKALQLATNNDVTVLELIYDDEIA